MLEIVSWMVGDERSWIDSVDPGSPLFGVCSSMIVMLEEWIFLDLEGILLCALEV